MAGRISESFSQLIDHQRGVLARWQAAECARDLAAIDSLLRAGRWQTLYRGVYAAHNGPASRDSLLWAGALRCGPAAALSHFTAGELDGLVDRPREVIHVSIPDHQRVCFSKAEFDYGSPRIVLHRSVRLCSARHPARTPPRTRTEETVLDLVDLADTFDAAFGWLSAACGRRLVTAGHLRRAVASRARLRWRADVLAALEEISEGVMSNLERGYVRNVERAHGLPAPQRQVRLRRGMRSAYLDVLYDDFGLAIELDGLGSHPAEARWQDIHRDNHFAGEGIITLRYSWADITCRPCQVAAEIALVLRMRGWIGTLRSCGSACQSGIC
jgi:hypothetical protein